MRGGRLVAGVALALAGCVPAARPAAGPPPSTLAASLDSIFSDTAFASAHWGVLVKSLATGETLYQRNAARAFVPASSMKLRSCVVRAIWASSRNISIESASFWGLPYVVAIEQENERAGALL